MRNIPRHAPKEFPHRWDTENDKNPSMLRGFTFDNNEIYLKLELEAFRDGQHERLNYKFKIHNILIEQ